MSRFIFVNCVLNSSVAEEHVVAKFDEVLIDNFPTTFASFCESLAAQTVDRLSLYLHFLPGNEHLAMADYQAVVNSLRVLKALPQITSGLQSSELSEDEDEDERISSIRITVKHSSQNSMKRKKRAVHRAAIDPRIFENAGLHPPESVDDVNLYSQMMLQQLKATLKVNVRPYSTANSDLCYQGMPSFAEKRGASRDYT